MNVKFNIYETKCATLALFGLTYKVVSVSKKNVLFYHMHESSVNSFNQIAFSSIF